MTSLQDQLLKAGLIDQNKAKKAHKDKRKQVKAARKSNQQTVDQSRKPAQKAQTEKSERDRELNRQRQVEVKQKAISAQIRQLIQINKIDRAGGEVAFNFVDQNKVRKIYITEQLRVQLSSGRLAIVKLLENKESRYEIVPIVVAEKITQRDKSCVIQMTDTSNDEMDGDDPYADYQIPEDLMW